MASYDKYSFQREKDARDSYQRNSGYIQQQPQPFQKQNSQQPSTQIQNQQNKPQGFQQQRQYSKPVNYSMLKSQATVAVDDEQSHKKQQSKATGSTFQKDKLQTGGDLQNKQGQRQPQKQKRSLFLCNPKNVHAYDVVLETHDNRHIYTHSNTLTFHSLWFRELLSMNSQDQSTSNTGNSSSTNLFSSRKQREPMPKIREQVLEEVEEELGLSDKNTDSDSDRSHNSDKQDKPVEVRSSKRKIKIITVQDSSADLNSVLQIAYLPGQLSITLDNVDQIINIASKYQMPHILFYGEEFLCGNDFKNSEKFQQDPLRWAIVAKKLKLENFTEVCIAELQNCIDRVLDDSRAEQLGQEMLLKVFKGVWQKFSVAYVDCMKTRDRYKEDRDRMRFEKDHMERMLHNGSRHPYAPT